MSGPNRVPSGPQRFENLDCPVEVGEPCVSPELRGWTFERSVNIPSIIAVVGMLGSLVGYVILNDRRATATEGQIELLKQADKAMQDHSSTMEQIANRDRAEMQSDIKEIKQMLMERRR